MVINCKQWLIPCACANGHSLSTVKAVIEAGCLQNMDAYLSEAGITGPVVAVYDSNTYDAEGLTRPKVAKEIVLLADGLKPDDSAVASLLHQVPGDAAALVAIGGGTLHQIVSVCAHRLSIPYVSCPTAASTDTFLAGGPVLMLADLDVLCKAPAKFMHAGVGTALSKFIALADWQIANLLSDMPICASLEALLRQSAIAAQGACEGLAQQSPHGMAQLMYSLVLSGIAMQAYGTHGAGEGAESLLADLLMAARSRDQDVLRGETVGICSAAVAGRYHEVVSAHPSALPERGRMPAASWISRHFGDATMQIFETEKPSVVQKLSANLLEENWDSIRRIVSELPTEKEMTQMLASVGAKPTLESLGLQTSDFPRFLQLAAHTGHRLTLLHVLTLKRSEKRHSKESASFAPSRSKRYADSAIKRAGKRNAISGSTI